MVCGEPANAVGEHSPKLQHRCDALARSGHGAFHLVDERLYAHGHGYIKAVVRIRADGAKGLFRGDPVHIQPVTVEQRAHRTLMLALAHLTHFMECCFKLEASSAERCGTATGEIMLFQHEDLPAFLCEVCCRA